VHHAPAEAPGRCTAVNVDVDDAALHFATGIFDAIRIGIACNRRFNPDGGFEQQHTGIGGDDAGSGLSAGRGCSDWQYGVACICRALGPSAASMGTESSTANSARQRGISASLQTDYPLVI
jgi:hypothetical protein